MTSVPDAMLIWPVKELLVFVGANEDQPVIVNPPEPVIWPPKVVRVVIEPRFVSKLIPPMVSVPPDPSTSDPFPESEPTVTL